MSTQAVRLTASMHRCPSLQVPMAVVGLVASLFAVSLPSELADTVAAALARLFLRWCRHVHVPIVPTHAQWLVFSSAMIDTVDRRSLMHCLASSDRRRRDPLTRVSARIDLFDAYRALLLFVFLESGLPDALMRVRHSLSHGLLVCSCLFDRLVLSSVRSLSIPLSVDRNIVSMNIYIYGYQ